MTTGEGRPVVIDLSTSHGEDRYMNRSVKRRRSVGRRLPVKANLSLMKTDISGPAMVPGRIENLDLHTLISLHAHLEAERVDMPSELVVPGKVSG